MKVRIGAGCEHVLVAVSALWLGACGGSSGEAPASGPPTNVTAQTATGDESPAASVLLGGEALASPTVLVVRQPFASEEDPRYANVLVFDGAVGCADRDDHTVRADSMVHAGRGSNLVDEELAVTLFDEAGDPLLAQLAGAVNLTRYDEQEAEIELQLEDASGEHRLTGTMTAPICPPTD